MSRELEAFRQAQSLFNEAVRTLPPELQRFCEIIVEMSEIVGRIEEDRMMYREQVRRLQSEVADLEDEIAELEDKEN